MPGRAISSLHSGYSLSLTGGGGAREVFEGQQTGQTVLDERQNFLPSFGTRLNEEAYIRRKYSEERFSPTRFTYLHLCIFNTFFFYFR